MADGLHYKPSMDSPDVPPGDDEMSEIRQAAEEAFPAEDWSPERLDALKTLMKLCMDDYGGGDESEGPDDKHAGLALLFGAPKKK
jgi:hypothetical protein